MSVDSERRRRLEPEFEGEQEFDFGRYARAIGARWWLLAAGLAAGILVGILLSVGKSTKYDAAAIVYLGQPFPPGGTSPIQNLTTAVALANEVVTSRSTLREVAGQIGVKPGKLTGGVSARLAPGVKTKAGNLGTPLFEINVTGLPARKEVSAANRLAAVVVTRSSTYVDQKLRTYDARFARSVRERVKVLARLAFADQQQKQLLANHSISPAEKLIVLANLNNVIQFNEQRRANLEQSQLTLRDLQTLGRQIERARVVEPARAHRGTPPGRRSSALVGGVIGLFLAALAALLWEPIAARLPSRPEQ